MVPEPEPEPELEMARTKASEMSRSRSPAAGYRSSPGWYGCRANPEIVGHVPVGAHGVHEEWDTVRDHAWYGTEQVRAAMVGNYKRFRNQEAAEDFVKSPPEIFISRDTVAAVCVEALFAKNASNRVVEIVASPDAPKTSPDTWFA